VAWNRLDDVLDLWDAVVLLDDEPRGFGSDLLVLEKGHQDAFRTLDVRALADELEGVRVGSLRLGDFVDLFVDLTTDCSFCARRAF
jgi:hypothetical protein